MSSANTALVQALSNQLVELREAKARLETHAKPRLKELNEVKLELESLRWQLRTLQTSAAFCVAVRVWSSPLNTSSAFEVAVGLVLVVCLGWTVVHSSPKSATSYKPHRTQPEPTSTTPLAHDGQPMEFLFGSGEVDEPLPAPPELAAAESDPGPDPGSDPGATEASTSASDGKTTSLQKYLPDGNAEAKRQLDEEASSWDGVEPTYEDSNGLVVSHRHAGGPFHDFKFDVTLESELVKVFALARELDLMSTWNPFARRGDTLGYSPPSADTNAKLRGYVEIALPWPLPNIAVVLTGVLYDLLDEDGSIGVLLGSEREPNTDEADTRATDEHTYDRLPGERLDPAVDPPTTPSECPRLWLRVTARAMPLRLAPEDASADAEPPASRFVVTSKVRFPIASTPQWVIRFVVRVMAPLVISKVRELLGTLMNEDSEFPARVQRDTALYEHLLSRRVRQTFTKRAHSATEANGDGAGAEPLEGSA